MNVVINSHLTGVEEVVTYKLNDGCVCLDISSELGENIVLFLPDNSDLAEIFLKNLSDAIVLAMAGLA